MTYSKKDFISSIVTGLITGFITWRVFNFLNLPQFRGISFAWLILVIPIVWILGVNLGYLLGRWFSFFNQFGKFVAIGFTNSAVDFGVLNLSISFFDAASGPLFSVFKGISFVFATIHSYFWNKYWAFEAGQSHGGGKEFLEFFLVALSALIINVGVASFVVNFIMPIAGVSPEVWANIGAVAGAAAALIVSFLGFKIIVFKK